MELIDGHMHLENGPLDKEYVFRFIEEADKKGLTKIQILDHTHRFKEFQQVYEPLKVYEIQKNWLEDKEKKFTDSLDDYDRLIKEVKKEKLPIKVDFGLEVCYTSETEELIREALKGHHYDFLIGAIHSVDNILYDMSFSEELLWTKRNVDDIYRSYYEELIKCVDSQIFTQLAHPDTLKLFNYYPTYDLGPTYHQLCECLKKNKLKAECNVGCYYRYNHKDLGLSDELLKCFISENVELITASDAHKPEDVGNYIKDATIRINKLKEELYHV